jgi:hypothetical protein
VPKIIIILQVISTPRVRAVNPANSDINVHSSVLDGHRIGRQTTPLGANLPDKGEFWELRAPLAHRLARAQRKRRAMCGTPNATVRHLPLQKLCLSWQTE